MFFTIFNSEEEGFKDKRYNDSHNNLVAKKKQGPQGFNFWTNRVLTNDIVNKTVRFVDNNNELASRQPFGRRRKIRERGAAIDA